MTRRAVGSVRNDWNPGRHGRVEVARMNADKEQTMLHDIRRLGVPATAGAVMAVVVAAFGSGPAGPRTMPSSPCPDAAACAGAAGPARPCQVYALCRTAEGRSGSGLFVA